MAVANTNTIKLRSSDNRVFTVEVAVIAKMSETIGITLEDLDLLRDAEGDELPLPDVTGNILEKVIEWCERNYRRELTGDEKAVYQPDEQLAEWNRLFLRDDNEDLYPIIQAAKYLGIWDLLKLCTNSTRAEIIEIMRECGLRQ